MTRHHIFDSTSTKAQSWLNELAAILALPADDDRRASRALRAGLHAIRDRLPAPEVVDLGAQLPTLIRGIYYEGWRLDNHLGVIRDRTAMLARVSQELAHDPKLDPANVLRATIALLRMHVSAGEINHVLTTLPRKIAELWDEATPAVAAPLQQRSI